MSAAIVLALAVVGGARADPVPSVRTVVLRLDRTTNALKGYFVLDAPYRKTLPPEYFIEVGDVQYVIVPPGDFGYTEIRGRLTGELVAHAGTVWSGRGVWEYPAESLMRQNDRVGHATPPESFDFVPSFGSSRGEAEQAWSAASQAAVVESLAAVGPYRVVVFDHYYTVGLSDPSTAEWIVVASSHPPAPRDLGIVSLDWPAGDLTRGACVRAEARIHNYGDSQEALAVRLRVTRGGRTFGEQLAPLSIAAESTSAVRFEGVTPAATDSATFEVALTDPRGAAWRDVFADDDRVGRTVPIVPEPTLRLVAWGEHPGPIPTNGTAVDADGDGDLDIVTFEYWPRLLLRESDGTYRDATPDLGPVPAYPRLVIARDLDHDGRQDLLGAFFGAHPVLLRGTASGRFVDGTVAAGLGDVTSFVHIAVLDLEGDGDPDLIFAAQGEERVMANDGSGHFADVTTHSGLIDANQTERIEVLDANGDGHPDVLFVNWGAASRLFVNRGDGTFTESPGPWTQTYVRQVLPLDFDGDGRQDLLFLNMDRSWLYRNEGGLVFRDVSEAAHATFGAFAADAADLDGDGLPEVAVEDGGPPGLYSDRHGVFVDRSDLLVNILGARPGYYDTPSFLDLDGDGLLDLYERSAVYLNQGLDCAGDPPPPAPKKTIASLMAYPNPASVLGPPVQLSYRLPSAARIRVTIRDVQGRTVRHLFQGNAAAGPHALPWDGRDDDGRRVSPGVYLHRIELPAGEVVTGRTIVLR